MTIRALFATRESMDKPLDDVETDAELLRRYQARREQKPVPFDVLDGEFEVAKAPTITCPSGHSLRMVSSYFRTLNDLSQSLLEWRRVYPERAKTYVYQVYETPDIFRVGSRHERMRTFWMRAGVCRECVYAKQPTQERIAATFRGEVGKKLENTVVYRSIGLATDRVARPLAVNSPTHWIVDGWIVQKCPGCAIPVLSMPYEHSFQKVRSCSKCYV